MEIEKGFLLEVAGRVPVASADTRIYLRTTTSFAKSQVKSLMEVFPRP